MHYRYCGIIKLRMSPIDMRIVFKKKIAVIEIMIF